MASSAVNSKQMRVPLLQTHDSQMTTMSRKSKTFQPLYVPRNSKVRTTAHTKDPGWYVDLGSREKPAEVSGPPLAEPEDGDPHRRLGRERARACRQQWRCREPEPRWRSVLAAVD